MKKESTPSTLTQSAADGENGVLGRTDTVTQDLARHVHAILECLGEDPSREGLLRTPHRVSRAWQFLLQGYDHDPRSLLEAALFDAPSSQMILIKDIEVFSLCEHHMLPFFGKAHVAYVPTDKIVGLSKIPRVVDAFARRLQVQERLTTQIRDAIQRVINPLGVAVIIEATHLCMVMRGVQKLQSVTVTSAMSGEFLESTSTRSEFLRLIGITS